MIPAVIANLARIHPSLQNSQTPKLRVGPSGRSATSLPRKVSGREKEEGGFGLVYLDVFFSLSQGERITQDGSMKREIWCRTWPAGAASGLAPMQV